MLMERIAKARHETGKFLSLSIFIVSELVDMVRVHTTSLTVLYTHSTITVKIQLNKRKNYVNLELTEIPAAAA